MEKWAIRPDPTPFDPRRHVLLVKGDMKDISAILRKFGALCGRPSPTSTPEGYNYSLILHAVTQVGLERISAGLNEMSAALIPSATTPPPAVPPTLAPITIEPPLLAPPAPAAPPPVAAPPPAAAPAVSAFAPAPRDERPMWGMAIALDPACSFDTLLVGPYNRFAHAAATSVVGSPGSMYNPLFLYGSAGVGKTHLAGAIAQGLAAALTMDGVIMTSGARLARAVTESLADSRFGELEQFLAARKALVVDDIHLLAVTEANRSQLARVFELFFSKGLQVVLTSIYPPKALGALEEALNISLGKGWSVDLKVSGQNVQLELLQSFFDKAGLQTTNEVTRLFWERMVGGYGEWKRWATRLKELSRIMSASGQAPRAEELIPVIFDPGVAAGSPEFPSPEELSSVTGFSLPPAGAAARNLAVLLPNGQENLGAWVLSRFHEAGKQFNVPAAYRQVLLESYDAGQPFGVPFQIGDMCARSGAQAALLLGPPADSGLAARVGEFSHAVRHILEGLDVAMGWVPHNGTTSPHHFLRAHLDLLPPSA